MIQIYHTVYENRKRKINSFAYDTVLDTGASISVLKLPSFHVIAKQLNLNVPKNIENQITKTLTVANQTEVPIIHYVSMTCFTEVNHQNRSFNIEFAIANIKYNFLGAPFLKKIKI